MEEDNSYDVLNKALLEENTDMRIQTLRRLIEAGKDVNSYSTGPSELLMSVTDSFQMFAIECGITVLMKAANNGYLECIKVLLNAGAVVDQLDTKGQTAVMKAARNEHSECVRVLLEAGANVNHADEDGNTLIMTIITQERNTCVSNSGVECLRLVLTAGVDVNQSDKTGDTALMLAAIYEDTKCMRVLLDAGANISQTNKDGETALMKCVTEERDTRRSDSVVECMRLLLEAGADVNKSDVGGYTVLMSASFWGKAEWVTLLLGAGAIVNQSGKSGHTALMSAAGCYEDVNECMRLLLEAGADVNTSDSDGDTALLKVISKERDTCVSNREVECARLLLDAGANVNQSDKRGQTALMAALFWGEIKWLPLLLEFGADVNLSDENGKTALMSAASNCDVECAKVLLGASANVNQSDREGQTALLHCLGEYSSSYGCGSIDCLKLLVNTGADIDAPNNRNLQPIHYALSKRYVRWTNSKCPAEFLISENCDLSQASCDKVKAIATYRNLSEDRRLDILKLLFACGLPRHLCQSFIVEEDTSVKNWVEHVASQPNTLQSICVFQIRRILGLGIKSKVPTLDLTSVGKDLLLLKGILSSECFI